LISTLLHHPYPPMCPFHTLPPWTQWPVTQLGPHLLLPLFDPLRCKKHDPLDTLNLLPYVGLVPMGHTHSDGYFELVPKMVVEGLEDGEGARHINKGGGLFGEGWEVFVGDHLTVAVEWFYIGYVFFFEVRPMTLKWRLWRCISKKASAKEVLLEALEITTLLLSKYLFSTKKSSK